MADDDIRVRAHRWNIERTDTGIRVCEGLHPNSEGCDWEYFDRALSATPSTGDAERYAKICDAIVAERDSHGFRSDAAAECAAAIRDSATKGSS